MDLIPIKVKIGLRPNGHADHPEWTKLPMINSDSEVRQYAPLGWMYDSEYGHADSIGDSPIGMQWGCLLVTRAFADEAITTFPLLITELTEAEFENFHDNRITAHLPDVKYDMNTLKGLKLEHDLLAINGADTAEIKAKIAKAIDKNDIAPGIKTDKSKKWADLKSAKGIVIK